jgi:hypothetical protein
MLCNISSWTLDNYRNICETALAAGYQPQSIADHIRSPQDNVVILRHDVDRFPENALGIAKLEHQLGVRSTYYFRMVRGVFSPRIIRQIQALGHEIGYHYETLSKCNGNRQRAIEAFTQELSRLRTVAEVTTTSAHGSPLSRWDNRTLWSDLDSSALCLTGDAYSAIDYSTVVYFTDTGRRWDADRTNLRDRPPGAATGTCAVHETDDLVKFLASQAAARICIQTHPERWSATHLQLIRSAAFDISTSTAKKLLSVLRGSGA